MTNERIATLYCAVLCALDDQGVDLSELIAEGEAVVIDRKLSRIEKDGFDANKQKAELIQLHAELKAEMLTMKLSEGSGA